MWSGAKFQLLFVRLIRCCRARTRYIKSSRKFTSSLMWNRDIDSSIGESFDTSHNKSNRVPSWVHLESRIYELKLESRICYECNVKSSLSRRVTIEVSNWFEFKHLNIETLNIEIQTFEFTNANVMWSWGLISLGVGGSPKSIAWIWGILQTNIMNPYEENANPLILSNYIRN